MESIIKNLAEPVEILVVDDVLESSRSLTRILKHQGYLVTSTDSGEKAFNLISFKNFDLILLDVRMPGIGGLELCRKIKENPNTSSTPVIFISAMGHIEDKTKGFEVGGVDYISKPYQAEEVILRVNNILKLTSQNKEKLQNSVQELYKSEKRYAQLREQSKCFTWEVDEDGLYTFVDYVSEMVTGYKPEELISKKHFYDFCPINERAEFSKNAFAAFESKQEFVNLENKIVTKDGTIIWVSTNGIPLLDESGNLIGYRGSDTDITDQKKKEEEIIYLSHHDRLTGLNIRMYFDFNLEKLDTEINLPMTIAMLDINGLKLVNDSFGHASGDELLKKAALVIKKSCRPDYTIIRWGGDEFLIIMPKTDSVEAEKIISNIKNLSYQEMVGVINLSISFGSSTKVNSSKNISDIIKKAEDDLHRNKLYEGSGMRSATIELIMNTLYEKNNREMFHSKRVGALCESIAVQMGYKNDEVAKIKMSGLMHDIGKIGIEETILNKSDKLTDVEWNEMKKHSEIGYRILSSANEFLELAKFVLEHQEKWDGTGYPRGLKREEISKQARIIAIADAFDAMTSERTYGEKLSIEEAKNEIARCAGTQFDPEIAKMFIEKVLK